MASRAYDNGRRSGLAATWKNAPARTAMVTLALILLAGCGLGAAPEIPPERSATASAETSPPETPEGPLGREEIAEIQTILAKRGYEPGPVDGRMGPMTSRAIARYQRGNGLPVDGLATQTLKKHLQAQPETAPEIIPVEAVVPSSLFPAGTRFVYSGNEIHTITRVEGAKVRWETNLGDRYTTGPYFGLPETEWRTGNWKGTATSTLPPEISWPPSRGMNLHFDVASEEWNEAEGEGARHHVSDSSWSCRNEGASRVNVPAGSFEADRIVCERSPAPAGAWQKRVWYYVPAIGHFVRREDFDGAGLELGTLELIALVPGIESPTLQKGLQGAVQDALDRNETGESTVWRNPVGDGAYEIRVNGLSDGPDGAICRSYSIERDGEMEDREYPAMACRGAGTRRWIIPGLG